MALEQIVLLGSYDDPIKQADYILESFCKVNPEDVAPEEKPALISTITYLITQNKLVSAPYSFETNGVVYKTLENLLNIKVRHFIELVNCDLKEDSFENYHLVAACLYREDWSKPFSEEETINNAKHFWSNSCKYGIWGVEMFTKLISLLRSTYPILYEGKQEDKQSEGRRAYSMLNGLAKDDPTKWEAAENLELWRAFVWMEEKEIQRQNEKQQQRSN